MKTSILTSIALSISLLTASAQTVIPPNSSISGVYTLEESPYIFQGIATIPENSTLTIEPGVELRFAASESADPSVYAYANLSVGMLRVDGTLIAEGTEADSIRFTRNEDAGNWGIIFFSPTSSASSVIKYATVEHAATVRELMDGNDFPGAITFYKSDATVANCRIQYNGKSFGTYNLGCGVVTYRGNSLIINNIISDNAEYGIWGLSDYGIATEPIIVGNLIANNKEGINSIFCSPLIINNTIVNNTFQGLNTLMSDATIVNTIFWGNSASILASSSTIGISYSLIEETTLPAGLTDNGNNILGSNPLFSDSQHLAIQEISPAVNAGNPNTTGLHLPSFDIMGQPRIDDETIDIGAYEFQSEIVELYLISFTVSDQNVGIAGAIITLEGSEDNLITNSEGKASAQRPNGTYNYTMVKEGYTDFEDNLTVDGADLYVNIGIWPVNVSDEILEQPAIYPNPFSNTLRVKNIENATRISLYNAMGVLTKKIDLSTHNETIINTSDLDCGIYLVVIQNRDGIAQSYKMVKQ